MIKTGKAGSGTYGTVYNAKMGKDDTTEIAVKRNIIDSEISFSGSIREMDLLNRLRGHPFIVKLVSVTFGNPFTVPNSPLLDRKNYSSNDYREDYLHFVFEKGDKNLHNLIYEKEIHVSYLKLAMVQILLSVEYMHAKGVIHRDIKPANLLWFVDNNSKTSVKICDFGLSKIKTFQEPSSPHVVTCWYRAPEICSHSEKYSFSSDIWSVGCVFFEMIAQRALLMGTKDDDNKLLSKMIGLIPSPTNAEIYKIAKGIKLTKEASPMYRRSWKDLIGLNSASIEEFNKYPNKDSNYDNFLDLLSLMLKLNPEDRITAEQALAHPFFKPYESIIEWCRTNFPPLPKTEPIISILECIERKWAVHIAFKIFNDRATLNWYRHRILFQSLDLFDRYLIYLSDNCSEFECRIPSNLSGKYMTKYESELRYTICLYMSIKYFTTLNVPISFSELMPETVYSTLIEGEEFEQKMLKDVLRFKVYRETIYEAGDRLPEIPILDEYKIRDLFYLYGKSPSRTNVPISSLLLELLQTKVNE